MTTLLPIAQCQTLSDEELRARQELYGQMVLGSIPSSGAKTETLREQEREREQTLRDSARVCDPRSNARIV